jgi:Zn ribbon nucleic-acid-binding protein
LSAITQTGIAPAQALHYDRYPLAVPNTGNAVPIVCPECHYDGCMVVVRSLTVIMVKCVSCRHTWAAELNHLPEEIQLKVQAVVPDDLENDHR